MDKLALEILLKDYTFYDFDLRTSTPEKFEYAKEKGLMFDDFSMSHDQGNDWLFEVLKLISKDQVVDMFLAGLTSRRLDWRSGLPAYAVARQYPDHAYAPTEGHPYICSVCGDYTYKEREQRNVNLLNQFRLATGGLCQIGMGPITLAFYLDQFSRIQPVKSSKAEEDIFWQIIELIENAEDRDKATDLEKKLSKAKLLKGDKNERREILETLALCGILETKEHKGFYKQYVPVWTREQRGVDTDMGYPLRWWRGKNKINEEALYFWFGKR
jgi:hypothetical protein